MALEKDNKLQFPHVLLIDASAGSGKTHTLSQRFVQFILSDLLRKRHNDLANILAITFTNNAAREMKQRIITWLKILALDLEIEDKQQIYDLLDLQSDEIRDRAFACIDTLIDRYSDFHVQTIDSFMHRILRSSADELGMPPDNNITESYTELTQAALNSLYARFGTVIPFSEIDAFLEFFNQVQGRFSWNPSWHIRKQFDGFLKQEGKILEELRFGDPWSRAEERYKNLYALYEQLKTLGLEDYFRAALKRGLGNGAFASFDASQFFKDFSPEDCGLHKKGIDLLLASSDGPELVQSIIPRAIELADMYSLSKYMSYGQLYGHFKSCLESVKRQTRTIHFDDINKRLSRYVREEIVPEIYYRLGDVLYHFLLDEFQDTDRVQWQNIQPLLHEAYAKGGTLFAVGDMKQAIYMFRKADYRIMRRLVQCIKGQLGPGCLPASVEPNARILSLENNFRSGSVILEYVDSIYKKRLSKLMPDILAEDRTGLTGYTQHAIKKKQGHGYVKTILINKSKNEEPEKQIVLDIVKDVKKRYPLREIAILAYKNEQVENIVAWLTEARIPAASFSSLDIRKRKLVMEIVNLLQFLNTPIDDLSFATFITGEIFLTAARSHDRSLTREKIFDFILEKKKHQAAGYLYTYLNKHDLFKDLWEKYFKRLYAIVGYYPLYDLVAEIYKTFDLFDQHPEETGFLVRFLEAISALEAQGMGSIRDFVECVSEESQESIMNILLPAYMEAVKAMTFHKAKGLGFMVVVNLFHERDDGPENMFFDPVGADLHLRYITKPMCKCSQHLRKLYDEAIIDNRIQTLNMFYVATTRAKNELYNLVIRPVKEEKEEVKPARKKRASKKPPASARKAETVKPLDLFENFEKGTKETPTEEKEYPGPTPVLLPAKTDYPFLEDKDAHWSVERLIESQEGDLLHAVLAEIEFLGDDSARILADTIQKKLRLGRVKYEPSEIQARLERFLGLPQVRSWFERKKDRLILREHEFVDEQGALFRMDRVIVDHDGVVLVDYKTGATLPFYAAQMKKYRRILQEVFPGKPVRCYFAYIDSGRIEELP